METSSKKIIEGYMPFMGYKTYYRIVGEGSSDKAPLVLLHGGPGSTHNYFELFDCLADTGRQIISYDQIGCGNSYVDGHPELWVLDTWMNEFEELRKYLGLEKIHILGQSWGGMMAIVYATDYEPYGVKSIILSSANPSASLWSKELHRMIKYLPENEQQAILEAEIKNDFSSEAYLAANDHFMQQHCAGPYSEKDPECLRRPKRSGSESYLYGWGPNEYTPSGSLGDFEYLDKMKNISVPTLITNGTDDLCSPCVAKAMFDNVPNARWELFQGSRHMPFADDTEHYIEILRKWLEEHD